MIKQVFGSFFRTIGRIIAYLLFGALLGLIFQNSDVFAADFTPSSSYFSMRYGTQSACDWINDGNNLLMYFSDFTNNSGWLALDSTQSSSDNCQLLGRLSFHVRGSSSNKFLADNTYTIRFTVDFDNAYELNQFKNNYEWDFIQGNTTTTSVTTGQEYFDNVNVEMRVGSTDNRLLIYWSFTLNTDLQYIGINFSPKDLIPTSNTSLFMNGSDLSQGSINFEFIKITYEEGSNAIIQEQTNVIKEQTDKINNSIENLLQVFQQDSDKMEDIYLNDTENEDGTCNGIICNLKKVVKAVINLPGTLITSIIDALKSLFIPDDFDFINDFKDSIESKLGFVAEIPSAMINFLFLIGTQEWEEMDSISFPEIEVFGYKFWNSQTIDLTEAINIFKPFKYITDVLCVIICINTMAKWRDKFTGGGN